MPDADSEDQAPSLTQDIVKEQQQQSSSQGGKASEGPSSKQPVPDSEELSPDAQDPQPSEQNAPEPGSTYEASLSMQLLSDSDDLPSLTAYRDAPGAASVQLTDAKASSQQLPDCADPGGHSAYTFDISFLPYLHSFSAAAGMWSTQIMPSLKSLFLQLL